MVKIEHHLNSVTKAVDVQIISICFRIELIKRNQFCSYCNNVMFIKKRIDVIDGYSWKCMNYNCAKYLTKKV